MKRQINEPEILRWGILDMQVCVPKHWDDKRVEEFALRKAEIECGDMGALVPHIRTQKRWDEDCPNELPDE